MSCVCRLISSCHEIKVWKALNNMACAAGLGAITGVLPKEYYQHAINALDQAWALILHDTAVAAGSFFQTSKAEQRTLPIANPAHTRNMAGASRLHLSPRLLIVGLGIYSQSKDAWKLGLQYRRISSRKLTIIHSFMLLPCLCCKAVRIDPSSVLYWRNAVALMVAGRMLKLNKC